METAKDTESQTVAGDGGTENRVNAPRTVAITGEIRVAGSAVARALARAGHEVRVLCPDDDAERAVLSAMESPALGDRVRIMRGTPDNAASLETLLRSAQDACILSPVGIHGRAYRPGKYVEDINALIGAAHITGLERLICQSSVAAHNESPAVAMRECADAELAAVKALCSVVRLRTATLMGGNDPFLNEMREIAQKTGFLMRVDGYGDTRLQPLHVDDLGLCVAAIVSQPVPRAGHEEYSRVLSVGGAQGATWLEIVDAFQAKLGKTSLKWHMPLTVLKLKLALSGNDATREAYNLMQQDYSLLQNDAVKLLGNDQTLKGVLDVIAAS